MVNVGIRKTLLVALAVLLTASVASAGWQTYVIRNSSSGGVAPQINDNSSYGQPAKEILIVAGGQKAAWGTSDLDGQTVGNIGRLAIMRFDDRTRFATNTGGHYAPYFNIWITDGLGHFAVIANEPSNAEFSGYYLNGYNFSWPDLANKTLKVHENSDKSWLPNNGVGLTFADVANFRIQAPSVAQLAAGWAGLGGGAPRELGTNLAYGINWMFGDTLSNYTSGDPGYVVAQPAAAVRVHSFVVRPQDLATSPAAFASNPFGFDWDSAIIGTALGAPSGYGDSSFFASVNQSGATAPDRYRTFRLGLTSLFGHSVTIGQVATLSYFTKKPAGQSGIDWRFSIYTTAQGNSGDRASWYRSRIQSHPSASANLNAPANQWNQWSTTGGAVNQLLFGGSNRPGFSAENMAWSALAGGPVTQGASTWDFSGEEVLFIDLILGANGGGGTGESQLDGLRVELANGEVADIDLQRTSGLTATLTLNPTPTSLFVKTGATVVVKMDVSGLQTEVKACQAMLGFDSSYLAAHTVVPGGGGIWDDMIYNVIRVAGEIDTAIGVKGESTAGTSADSTVAVIGLTAVAQGTTQMVFRADANPDEGLVASTYLSDLAAQIIWPTKVNSVNIIIDDVAPTISISAVSQGSLDLLNPANFAKAGVVDISVTASDALASLAGNPVVVVTPQSGSASAATFVSQSPAGTFNYTWTVVGGTLNGVAAISATVSDRSGNPAAAAAGFNIDTTPPVISGISATQNSVELTSGAPNAVLGSVIVTVSAADGGIGPSGLDSFLPVVTVVDSASNPLDLSAGTIVSPGVYSFTATVTAGTANGLATITANISDVAGNAAAQVTATFNVNKNQITGQLELEGLSPATVAGLDRTVTLVLNGAVPLTQVVHFSQGASTASYTLIDVPGGVTSLSAKTSFNLRRKIAVAAGTDGQQVADFTGAAKLLGGDLNESNSINVLDYTMLKTKWLGTDASVDINGDGIVNLLDYTIMKSNWFLVGEAQ